MAQNEAGEVNRNQQSQIPVTQGKETEDNSTYNRKPVKSFRGERQDLIYIFKESLWLLCEGWVERHIKRKHLKESVKEQLR